MKIDLRKDVAPIAEQIAQRVLDYDASEEAGPGEPDQPIQQITLGYQFDQAAWVALVFDTRPAVDAVYDGQWQTFIQENVLQVDVEHWAEAYESLIEEQTQISMTIVDGEEKTIRPDDESEDDEDDLEERLMMILAEYFGEVLRDALMASRKNGVFANLPLAANCVMRVDEHEGHYGWPDFEDRGQEPDEGRVVL